MSLSDLTCGLIDLFLAPIESFQGVRKPPNIRASPQETEGDLRAQAKASPTRGSSLTRVPAAGSLCYL